MAKNVAYVDGIHSFVGKLKFKKLTEDPNISRGRSSVSTYRDVGPTFVRSYPKDS